MFPYYRDVTLFALAICLLFGLASAGAVDGLLDWLLRTIIIFGVFGTGLGVLAFNYFQKQQYYMYHNLGFTKKELILKTWAVNFVIGIVIAIILALYI